MEELQTPKFNKLKGLLVQKEVTYSDLAKCIGRSTTTIQKKISGERKWDWEEMQKIRICYSLTDDEFMNIFFNQQVTKM